MYEFLVFTNLTFSVINFSVSTELRNYLFSSLDFNRIVFFLFQPYCFFFISTKRTSSTPFLSSFTYFFQWMVRFNCWRGWTILWRNERYRCSLEVARLRRWVLPGSNCTECSTLSQLLCSLYDAQQLEKILAIKFRWIRNKVTLNVNVLSRMTYEHIPFS